MRTLAGRAIALSHVFLDDETPLELTAVTVELKDQFGTVVVPAAAATENVADQSWSISIPAQPLGEYVAVWDGTDAIDETPVEVVAGFLFSIPQARNSDDYLSDDTAFPTDEIRDYREVVEQEFQSITGRSFTTRVVERVLTGDGSRTLCPLIPDAQAIEAVTIDGVVQDDVSGYTISALGFITGPACFPLDSVVRVRVRYGYRTPPRDVQRVAMIRLRDLLASESSGISDRATTWQPEQGGTYRLAVAGAGRWKTGIPEVDSTLANYTLDVVLDVFASG